MKHNMCFINRQSKFIPSLIYKRIFAILQVALFLILHPACTSPIMVKFGTKEGPIVPAPAKTTTIRPPNSYPTNPAPVYENQEDVPNPNVYKPLVPHQYRKQIYKYKPNPNLILGTPLDIKYTPGLYKYNGYQKIGKPAIGYDYRGPQTFGVQEYEKDYQKEQYAKYHNEKNEQEQDRKYENTVRDQDISSSRTVPQIGIVYSSGVRYYVPQIVYYNDDIDNSVYEANNLKYYYHNQKQSNYY